MYRLITKKGEPVWVKVDQPVLGRSEILNNRLDRWDLKRLYGK